MVNPFATVRGRRCWWNRKSQRSQWHDLSEAELSEIWTCCSTIAIRTTRNATKFIAWLSGSGWNTDSAVQMAMRGRSDWVGLATEIYAGKCSMPADRTRSAIAMTLSLAW